MNLFGVEISMSNKKDEKCYIEREDCHKAMEAVDQRISDLKSHIDTRLDDIKDLIKKI